MAREIIFDTETTGLNSQEDRIIEIGAVELNDRFPTGRTFHVYINPGDRRVHPDALAVHGISNDDLADKPPFKAIIDEWLEFTTGAKLIAHNAGFDIGFMNAEFARLGFPEIEAERVIDSLQIARRRHPMGPNSLDALCRRYGIDNSKRTKHGALLDSELLAEVYIELIGGKQAALSLESTVGSQETASEEDGLRALASTALQERERPLPSRLSPDDLERHKAMVVELGDKAVWLSRNQ